MEGFPIAVAREIAAGDVGALVSSTGPEPNGVVPPLSIVAFDTSGRVALWGLCSGPWNDVMAEMIEDLGTTDPTALLREVASGSADARAQVEAWVADQ